MASNLDLMKVEEALKQKYLGIVSNLSYTEQEKTLKKNRLQIAGCK